MGFAIRYSPQAQRDMDAVWDGVWEASKDFDVADRYISDLADRIAAKRTFPKSGIPLYYRGLFTGFYYVNFKAYRAFYRLRDGYIEVARVLLAKQDHIAILLGSVDHE